MNEYLEHIIEDTFGVLISTELVERDINLCEQMIDSFVQNGLWVCDLEPLNGKWALGATLALVGKPLIEIEERLEIRVTNSGKMCIDFDADYGWEELPLGLGFINAMGMVIHNLSMAHSFWIAGVLALVGIAAMPCRAS